MKNIYDTQDLPNRRLQSKYRFMLDYAEAETASIHMMKSKLFHEMFDKAMKDPNLFKSSIERVCDVSYIEFSIDCIVMTHDEYLRMRKDCFQQGVQEGLKMQRFPQPD